MSLFRRNIHAIIFIVTIAFSGQLQAQEIYGLSTTEEIVPSALNSPDSAVDKIDFDELDDDSGRAVSFSKESHLDDYEESCGCGAWNYIQIDALFLDRDNQSINQTIIIDDTTTNELLNSSELGLGSATGFRVLVGRSFNECRSFEASYYGTHNWNTSATRSDTNNLSLPGALGLALTDFQAADVMQVTYSSQLHNVEANLVGKRCNFDLLFGFRYMNLDESLNIQSTDIGAGTSDYNIQAKNDLFGGQIGARKSRTCGRFSLSVTGKAGVFANDTAQTTFLGDLDNTVVVRASRTTGTKAAFVGDLGINGGLRFCNNWTLTAGYNVLWIEGVSLALDQLDFTNAAGSGQALNDTGGVFYHGANVGLEKRW